MSQPLRVGFRINNNKVRSKNMAFKNITTQINDIISGIVALIKGLVVFFVFANILFTTGFTPIAGIISLINAFLGAGLVGLVALLIFVSFLEK